MIGWLAGLGLRVKIYAAVAAAALLAFAGLWVAWRLSSAKAARAGARADALERARAAELRISERISRVRSREREWRDQLSKRKERDHFEQGWGP
jgi:uncharacterized membrane protein